MNNQDVLDIPVAAVLPVDRPRKFDVQLGKAAVQVGDVPGPGLLVDRAALRVRLVQATAQRRQYPADGAGVRGVLLDSGVFGRGNPAAHVGNPVLLQGRHGTRSYG